MESEGDKDHADNQSAQRSDDATQLLGISEAAHRQQQLQSEIQTQAQAQAQPAQAQVQAQAQHHGGDRASPAPAPAFKIPEIKIATAGVPASAGVGSRPTTATTNTRSAAASDPLFQRHLLQGSGQIPIKNYSIYKDYSVVWDVSLGAGVNGNVVLCVDRKTRKNYALKCLRPRAESWREIKLQCECQDHPGIVQCIDVFLNVIQKGPGDHCPPTTTILLVMELMQEELFERIYRHRANRFSEIEAAEITQEIASIVRHLHKKNIAHRDLKPENFLYTEKDGGKLKISDFGFAKVDNGNLQTPVYTPYYVSGEVLQAHDVFKRKQAGALSMSYHYAYDKSCDMWSMGVILYIILCSYPPFQSETTEAISSKMKQDIASATFHFHEKYWSHISEEAKSVVSGLLDSNPATRMTAEQLCEHPWVKTKAGASTSPLNITPLQYSKQDFSDANTSMRRENNVHIKAQPNVLDSLKGPAKKKKGKDSMAKQRERLQKRNKYNKTKRGVETLRRSSGSNSSTVYQLASSNDYCTLVNYCKQTHRPDDAILSRLGKSLLASLENERACVLAALQNAGCDETGVYTGIQDDLAEAVRCLGEELKPEVLVLLISKRPKQNRRRISANSDMSTSCDSGNMSSNSKEE